MRIIHRPDIDYLSIEFKEGVESCSYLQDGVIIREDRHGHILRIDVVDSSKIFGGKETLTLQEAWQLLGISEATMRRRIKHQFEFLRPSPRPKSSLAEEFRIASKFQIT